MPSEWRVCACLFVDVLQNSNADFSSYIHSK
jgi:hypothetical protein